MNRFIDDCAALALSYILPQYYQQNSIKLLDYMVYDTEYMIGSESNVCALVSKVTNPSPGIFRCWGHAEGLPVTFLKRAKSTPSAVISYKSRWFHTRRYMYGGISGTL